MLKGLKNISLGILCLSSICILSSCEAKPFTESELSAKKDAALSYLDDKYPFESFDVTVEPHFHKAEGLKRDGLDFFDYYYVTYSAQDSEDLSFDLNLTAGNVFKDTYMQTKYSKAIATWIQTSLEAVAVPDTCFSNLNSAHAQHTITECLQDNVFSDVVEAGEYLMEHGALCVAFYDVNSLDKTEIFDDVKYLFDYYSEKTGFEHIYLFVDKQNCYGAFDSFDTDDVLESDIASLVRRINNSNNRKGTVAQ